MRGGSATRTQQASDRQDDARIQCGGISTAPQQLSFRTLIGRFGHVALAPIFFEISESAQLRGREILNAGARFLAVGLIALLLRNGRLVEDFASPSGAFG